eukprot:6199068-Pleurochrysis_carterae.AAC.1
MSNGAGRAVRHTQSGSVVIVEEANASAGELKLVVCTTHLQAIIGRLRIFCFQPSLFNYACAWCSLALHAVWIQCGLQVNAIVRHP